MGNRTYEHYINALYHLTSLETHRDLLSIDPWQLQLNTLEDAFNTTKHNNFKVYQTLAQEFGLRNSDPKTYIKKSELILFLDISHNSPIEENYNEQLLETSMGKVHIDIEKYCDTIIVSFKTNRKPFCSKSMDAIINFVQEYKNQYC